MITAITPSTIQAEYDGKSVTIEGEALLPGHGSPNYIIYSNSIQGWDVPHDSDPFTEHDKLEVIERLKKDLDDRNITYEIE